MMRRPEERTALALSLPPLLAWAVAHGHCDVVNFTKTQVQRGAMRPELVCIRSSRLLTRADYAAGAQMLLNHGVRPPEARFIACGGIVGVARVVEIVTSRQSPWWNAARGAMGLVFAEATPLQDAIPCDSAAGFYIWRQWRGGALRQPVKWMLPKAGGSAAVRVRQPDLFA